MIGVKAALMALAGIRAIPPMREAHNPRVHDANNMAQSLSAGANRVSRFARIAAEAAAEGDVDRHLRAVQSQDDVRRGLDDLARRLEN